MRGSGGGGRGYYGNQMGYGGGYDQYNYYGNYGYPGYGAYSQQVNPKLRIWRQARLEIYLMFRAIQV